MAGRQDTWSRRVDAKTEPADQGTTVTLVGKGDIAKLEKIIGAGGKPSAGR